VTGRMYVDAGAERAVRRSGGSLLAVGVVRCEGPVRAGDGVELCGVDGTPFGRGISSLDAAELAARPPNVEAVHRDRLILY
jgi:glutamate 5-kinase